MEFEKHILIVDDNLKNLQLTGKILKDEGYRISVASESLMVMEQLHSAVPDLILLDIMMPGMDGLQLCRQIKQHPLFAGIPVIFLTARSHTADLVEGFRAGAVDYVTKPFYSDELLIRVKTHLELVNARKKILEMVKNRDKLYSIIAHDIRSPLSGILFTLNAMKSGVIPAGSPDYAEMVESLEKSTSETVTLLNNLLSWANTQSESIRLAPREVNIYSLLSDCVSLMKGNAIQKNITVLMDVPTDTAAYLDELTMHTVFRNIISNAVKFTPPGGNVTISSSIAGDTVRLVFKDTGVGIPSDVLEKIVVDNQHYTSPGTAKEMGTGLGLMMVKDFVDKNKGTLTISSVVNSGTEIVISLPRSG